MEKEVFSVVSERLLNKRKYITLSCTEWHFWEVRSDVVKQIVGCKFCTQKYYKTKEYSILDSIMERCFNESNCRHYTYGARGIGVCDRWLIKPRYLAVKNFLEDMGECPEGLTLDRKDVNGNYCKENCRWADYSLQGYNQTQRITNTSGRVGVYFYKKKWKARIMKDYKTINLGSYDSFDEAVKAREEAELKYFGEMRVN